MDSQNYYELNNGKYCVFFPNRRGLSIEEITSIFSEFGEVAMVTKSGDDYGYRFVKYKNEDEAIRCVEGLRNHEFIKLKSKDPNFKKNRNQTNNDNNFASGTYGQKNYEHNNGQRTDFSDNCNRQGFSTPGADRNIKNNGQYVNNNISAPNKEYKPYSAGEQRINEARRSAKKVNDHEMVVQKRHELQETGCDISKSAMSLRRPAVASETFIPTQAKTGEDNVNGSSMNPHAIFSGVQNAGPKVICHDGQYTDVIGKAQNSGTAGPFVGSKGAVPHVQPENTAENIPKLVMSNPAYNSAANEERTKSPPPFAGVDTPKTETAQEVVVANIHTDFGVNYILHLFRKHDPLCISEMKMVSSLGLRFCIVYLQSLHQAYAIEKEFDKFKLSGKDLIVLRRDRLAELSA